MEPRARFISWNNRHRQNQRMIVFTTRPGGFEEALAEDILPAMDPIAEKVWVGAFPKVKPKLQADLDGLACSPVSLRGGLKL